MFRAIFICSCLILTLTASLAWAGDAYDQCIQAGKEYKQCLKTNTKSYCQAEYQKKIQECEQVFIRPYVNEKIHPDSYPTIGSNEGSSCHEASLRVKVCRIFSMIDGCKRIIRKYRVSCL